MKHLPPIYAALFLIFFYLVGIVGFLLPATHSLFSSLTPFALLLSAGFLIWFHKPGFNAKTFYIFSLIFVISFFAEMAGVKTGLLFGDYTYGNGLGVKIMGTPLIIGLNWLMLVYCTKVISDRLSPNRFIRLFSAPLMMVGYDLILEQAAPGLDMWYWAEGTVPIQNYLAWFLLAFLFHLLLRKADLDFKNPLALPVFFIQFLFFVTLVAFFMIGS